MTHVWLASYPRSGNTFLRLILKHCFNLQSCSFYPDDCLGNRMLEHQIGHIEFGAEHQSYLLNHPMPLIKTHEPPPDSNPAIYIVRDGRAACASLWDFYDRNYPLEACFTRHPLWGSWSEHLVAWEPYQRPHTLLLHYEEMLGDHKNTLKKLSTFLQQPILNENIPDRNTLAALDGIIVRAESDWRSISALTSVLHDFDRVNHAMMRKFGYSDAAE